MKKLIKTFCLIIIVMMVISMLPMVVLAASPTITVGTVTGKAGDTVSVPVELSGNTGIAGYEFDVSYDNTKLTYLGCAQQFDVFAETVAFVSTKSDVANKQGSVTVTASNDGLKDSNVNGKLAVLSFKIANGVTTDTISLTVTAQAASANDIENPFPLNGVNGAINVTPAPPAPVTPHPDYSGTGTGGNNGGTGTNGAETTASGEETKDIPDNSVPQALGNIITNNSNPFETGKKYISGYGDGSVKPDIAITRAEVAMIFFRLVKDGSKNDIIVNPFSDITGNEWYAQAVTYLASKGILRGYADDTFRANEPITRAEFVVIASRFYDILDDATIPFTDISKDYWAYESIASAYAKGWLSGYPDNTFRPEANITRAECVVIVNRILGRPSLDKIPDSLRSLYNDLSANHWAFEDILNASVDLQ
ncbi:MAG: S-layer homology domain-containing protein [Oscillospiraceae bacterium]|nr:S-layer homology domain-containing protein [Oscillospiraceae bacterium]